jgi:hypothetical protein
MSFLFRSANEVMSELVAFNRGDFKFLEDGSGRALIRRSKTDQGGGGTYRLPIAGDRAVSQRMVRNSSDY